MTLNEYLEQSRDEEAPRGTVGRESEWMTVATLTVKSGRLWIGDPQFSWAEANEGEGCVVDVPPGEYQVEAKGVDFAGVRVVRSVRAYLSGSAELVQGAEVDEAGTDSGQIGLADQPELKASFDVACGDDVDAALDMLEEGVDGPVGVFEPVAGGSGKVVFLPSGFGDGGGPVIELQSDAARVGIEHAFFAPDEPY
ncbi:MAG: hypothetical protein QGG36_07885 [Pirellulaceae bacterium]|jgi:hypothetical protein|nr:hypothetical protein [Pirellulaceae bacterium]MDP7015704.1 hypothetical protein [Pirellulaceae bacterium]